MKRRQPYGKISAYRRTTIEMPAFGGLSVDIVDISDISEMLRTEESLKTYAIITINVKQTE